MKIALIALAALTVAVAANAQTNGTISERDAWGNRHIQYDNGLRGTLSSPDAWGNQTLRYNDGEEIRYGSRDAWGNRSIQIQTMPRRGGW